MASERWLGVHFPLLKLEVCIRRLTGDAEVPVALIEDGKALAVNDVAAAAGILPGCSQATAAGICSDIVCLQRDAPAEDACLSFLAELAWRFTSHVSLAEPDGLRLEVGRSLRLFGGLAALCGEVEELYRGLGHELRLAVADTPLAATVLARAGTSSLQTVPLACTHLEPDAIERFANMGIESLGQVLALPAAELGQRFDPELLAYLDRLVGRLPDPQDLLVPTETFASTLHLVSSVQDGNALLFPVRRLAGELASWLASRRLGASEIVWTFTALHGEEASLAVRFARPRSDAGALFDHTRLRFEGIPAAFGGDERLAAGGVSAPSQVCHSTAVARGAWVGNSWRFRCAGTRGPSGGKARRGCPARHSGGGRSPPGTGLGHPPCAADAGQGC